MTDNHDKPDGTAGAAGTPCTERGMRATLVNLEEFAVMMSRRCSIRALEILDVVPPGREKPPSARPSSPPAAVIPHPATRTRGE